MVIETEGAEFVAPRARQAGVEPLFVTTAAGARWVPPPDPAGSYEVVSAGAADFWRLYEIWRGCAAESVLSLALLEAECQRDALLRDLLAARAPHVRMLANTPSAAALLADKALTKRALREAGFAVLPGAEAASLAEARAAAERFGFPLVVKPRHGFVGQGLRLARDSAALEAAFRGREGRPCLIEPFVAGLELAAEVVACDGAAVCQPLVDKGATRANLFEHPAYRVRVCPWDDGSGLAARVLERAQAMVRALGLWGIVELEFVVARGEAWLMEINPGPAGLSRLCSAAGGHDSFALATAAALGADPRAEPRGPTGSAMLLPIVRAPDDELLDTLGARADVAYVEPVHAVPTLPIQANLLLRGPNRAALRRSVLELAWLSAPRYVDEAHAALGEARINPGPAQAAPAVTLGGERG